MKKSEYLPYLRTLRRVPDDIILSVATRGIDVYDSDSCICGWVMREAIARAVGIDAKDVDVTWKSKVTDCLTRFGGTECEWEALYFGAANLFPHYGVAPYVERAFVERIAEAVS